MTGYTKLFGSIVASTIWREPHETRIVWITMLAMANKHGVVEASIPGLADMARVTLVECLAALQALAEPDEYSRTKDFEGRRIQPCEGGWSILNHAKYREKMGADERREYFRIKQQEARDRRKEAKVGTSKKRQQSSKVVKERTSTSTESTHAEAETDAQSASGKPEGAGTARAAKDLSTDEWLASLKADPTYAHVDIDHERGKMMRWCETNNKKPGRQRFVNWLNRCDKPLDSQTSHGKAPTNPRGTPSRNAGTANDAANPGQYQGVGRVLNDRVVQPRV